MAILNSREFDSADVEGVKLRRADAEECEAAGMTEGEAILMSLSNSNECWAIEVDGEIAAFWGYATATFLSGTCHLWLLTTPVVDKHKVKFCRVTQRMIREFNARWPLLEVQVDSRYLDAQKWLRWLGFIEVGVNNAWSVPFLIMRRG